MSPEDVLREIASQKLRPVYLVLGEERVLVDRTVAALRQAALEGGTSGFNEDKLHANETDVEHVLNAARTMPMMGRRRLVLLRGLERWDSQGTEGSGAASERGNTAMDKLTTYAASPVDSTCLVLVAAKLDGRRKLVTLAKKQGCIVQCDPIARGALAGYIQRAAKQRGHALDEEVAELLAEIAGPELGNVLDAVERLSLYVGRDAPIGEDAIAACVTRIRLNTVWELVGAVGRRDAATAMAVLPDVYDPQDRGLRLVGVLAWSVRQLLRFSIARRQGASPEDAAKRAGAPPFKARDLTAQTRNLAESTLEAWLTSLAEADLALKGSRRQARSILETAILTMAGFGSK